MYVDGRLVYTFNPTNRQGSLNTSDALRIGQRDGSGSYFKGNLDEVTIYKRALSATQIRNEYQAGADGKCK